MTADAEHCSKKCWIKAAAYMYLLSYSRGYGIIIIGLEEEI